MRTRIAAASLPAFFALASGMAHAQVPEWSSELPLPKPSGRYAIATAIFRLADTVSFPDGSRGFRPLTAQAWYPSSGGHSSKARYVEQQQLLDSMVSEKYLDLPPADIRGWRDLQLSASAEGTPAKAAGKHGWPLLVFSHGFGVSRSNYSALVQELASRGYVLVTIDHPYGGFALAPDGRVMQPGGDSLRRRLGSSPSLATVDSALAWDARRWAREAAKVVRLLATRQTGVGALVSLTIDTTRVGMLGHSLGGAAALQGCRDDPIFRACADMDGEPVGDVERDGVAKPVLVLLSQPAKSNAEPKDSAERARHAQFVQMGRERDSTWQAIVERSKTKSIPVFVVKLPGTGHFTFSDAPYLMPALLQGTGSSMSATKSYKLVVSYLASFFDYFLRGAPATSLAPRDTHKAPW